MQDRIDVLRKLDQIQEALIATATQDPGDTSLYPDVRRELLAHPVVGPKLPDYVRRFPELARFWPFIKRSYPTYAERREFIWDWFRPAVELVEGLAGTPADAGIDDLLKSFDAEHIYAVWQKALARRSADPEGAITAARTLLEAVCKHILDALDVTYTEDASLPTLYRQTADNLQLSPGQHSEQIFRQILGGCQSVVEGVGAVRNRLSDAHGRGRRPVKAAARHAELAVNLAGSMATFLVATWLARPDAAPGVE